MKRILPLLLTVLLLCSGLSVTPASAIFFEGELGDVNSDGSINASDALNALQHSVQLTALQGDAFERGEVSGDDVINAGDALLILQYSVKLIDGFPRDMEEENRLDTSRAYEIDPTADASFSLTTAGLAAKTVYTARSATLRHSSLPIKNDQYRFAVSLQGLLNRDFDGTGKTAMLFLAENTEERTWLGYVSGEGKFLEGYEQVSLDKFDDFLTTFDAQIKQCGFVLWDPEVPATANVAATMCAIDGYLPVKFDEDEKSLYTRLTERFGKDLVKVSLVDVFRAPEKGKEMTFGGFTYISSGSSKCDAYLWALEAYMNRCSAKYIAYTLDGAGTVATNNTYQTFKPDAAQNCIVNQDYYIARRCFFFDLCTNGTEAPCDDPEQEIGTDLETAKKILQARYDRAKGAFGQLFGFPPWWVKYTKDVKPEQGSWGGVQLEWDFAEWCTAYNLAKEADAAQPCWMFNASLYYKYVPTVENYVSNRPTETVEYDPNVLYFTFYLGDYDSSAWMKKYVTAYWMKDNKRGEFPMAWAFNPNLGDRAPMLFDYIFENKTPNDYFITGDSGAGYIVPSLLFEDASKRTVPDGSRAYVKYAAPYYKKYDMEITGFILNTNYPNTTAIKQVYDRLSPAGSFFGPVRGDYPLTISEAGVPYLYLHNGITVDQNSRPTTASDMFNHMMRMLNGGGDGGTNCTVFRNICGSPDDLYATMEECISFVKWKGMTAQYVDPYTLMELAKQCENAHRLGNAAGN